MVPIAHNDHRRCANMRSVEMAHSVLLHFFIYFQKNLCTYVCQNRTFIHNIYKSASLKQPIKVMLFAFSFQIKKQQRKM